LNNLDKCIFLAAYISNKEYIMQDLIKFNSASDYLEKENLIYKLWKNMSIFFKLFSMVCMVMDSLSIAHHK